MRKIAIETMNLVFTSLLITFVTLKLCGIINWRWIWVLSPLWVSFLLAIVLIIGAIVLKGRTE